MIPALVIFSIFAVGILAADRFIPTEKPLVPYAGPVSDEMTAWARAVLNSSVPLGYVSPKRVFGTDTLVARVEPHTWTIRDGVRVAGNFRGVTLYRAL